MRDMLTLNDALRDYYEVRAGRYELRTWRCHEARLEHFRTWVTRETQPDVYLEDIAGPGARYMERYFNKLRPPAYAPGSFNNARQYLTGFWKYTIGRGWVLGNPMMHIDALRVPRVVRLQLAAGELLSMLEDANPRDRVALALGMNTALRANDITGLKVGNVNLENNTITAWVEKTDEERIFPITEELRVELLRWLKHYADVAQVDVRDLPNSWILVPAARWCGINPRNPALGGVLVYTEKRMTNPQRIVQTALRKLGHDTKGEGFHTLRRSAARVLFDLAAADGVRDPIRIPQSLLGHTNRATTERYLGVTHEATMRDEMMKGKSFLGRAAELNAAQNREQDGYGELRSA